MTIKSYIIRAGRMSKKQKFGLEKYLMDYKLEIDGNLWNLSNIFQREAQTIVEIGFGMGASLLKTAQEHPEINFIGVDVHRAGIGSLAANLHDNNLNNVRIVIGDAKDVFLTQISQNILDGVQIFFPDPWPKQKHHKRRLIQPDFVLLLVSALKSGGFLHCATDWQDYAEYILKVLEDTNTLQNQVNMNNNCLKSINRHITKFELRGNALGHNIWDFIFYKIE